MKITAGNVEFVGNELYLDYQDVIEELDVANQIRILTYNISNSKEFKKLITRLSKLDCDIVLVTSIPSWQYLDFYPNSRSKVRDTFNDYINVLKPLFDKKNIKLFFSKNNHGKIIGTESIVYFGSANFSLNSRNIETGCISRNREFINRLYSEFFDGIVSESIPMKHEHLVFLDYVHKVCLEVMDIINVDILVNHEVPIITESLFTVFTSLLFDIQQSTNYPNNDTLLESINNVLEINFDDLFTELFQVVKDVEMIDRYDSSAINFYNELVVKYNSEQVKKYNEEIKLLEQQSQNEQEFEECKRETIDRYAENELLEICGNIDEIRVSEELMEEAIESAKYYLINEEMKNFENIFVTLSSVSSEIENYLNLNPLIISEFDLNI